MNQTRRSIALLAIVGALGFAGCGDDDDEAPTTTAESGTSGATGEAGSTGSIAPEALAAGNEICAEGNKDLEADFGALGQNPKPSELEGLVGEAIIPNIQAQIDGLRELEAGDADDQLQSTLDDAEEILAEVESDPELFFEGDAFADINEDLTELGLVECAS